MPRELSLLLAPADEGPVALDRNQRREFLRRLECVEKLEIDNALREREKQALRKELEEKRRELERLRKSLAALGVAPLQPRSSTDPPFPPSPVRWAGTRADSPAPPQVRPRHACLDEALDLTFDLCPGCGEQPRGPSDSYERFVTGVIAAPFYVREFLVDRYCCRPCHTLVHATREQALPGCRLGPRLARSSRCLR